MEASRQAIQEQVEKLVLGNRLIPSEYVHEEIDWFFNKLGIADSYFHNVKPEFIPSHVQAVYATKILAASGEEEEFHLHQEGPNVSIFAIESVLNRVNPSCTVLERRLEEKYLLEGYAASKDKLDSRWQCSCFRTTGTVSEKINVQLRFYVLTKPVWAHPNPNPNPNPSADTKGSPTGRIDIKQLASTAWLAQTPAEDVSLLQGLMEQAVDKMGPVVSVTPGPASDETRVHVLYKSGSTHSFFSAITCLYNSLKFYSTQKHVSQFSNGYTAVSYHIKPHPLANMSPNEIIRRVYQFANDIALLYTLPRTNLTPLAVAGTLTFEEVTYAYVVGKFTCQFLRRHMEEYAALRRMVPAELAPALLALRKSLQSESVTEERLFASITAYPELVKLCYEHFATRHHPDRKPLRTSLLPDINALEAKIIRVAQSEFDADVFKMVALFNKHCLKTNFFKASKTCLVFRVEPSFLPTEDYPQTPYSIFFVVAPEFRGFHIRFADVARGGVRVITSRDADSYRVNSSTLFDENYDLACTQQRKNKDIPEGGAKGTILLSLEHQDKVAVAFQKYVDGLLDLLLPADDVVDHMQASELLFLGPDERTGPFMAWAAQHAQQRGYARWRAFTTGKPRSMGGIPHDTFGMTTRGVLQFTRGVQRKLGLVEKRLTKFQTGGPDGDLGSNEILLGDHTITAIVDGSGVLYDPAGLDRQELVRLATHRLNVSQFARARLSNRGFFVGVDERDVSLPDGSAVESGLAFRNNFHLDPRSSADCFVPCGGRPQAVNSSNWEKLLDKQGRPRFKFVVEGANLFFTQDSRVNLERKGLVLFKDASANKGGVTSSSNEVLASLAMTDEEYNTHMLCPSEDENKAPEFYKAFVNDVIDIIQTNASLEFECLWRESKASGTPASILTETLSNKINSLHESLLSSSLWKNMELRKTVLSRSVPKTLLKLVGIDKLQQRVPESYLKDVFGAYLASRFVYTVGLGAPEYAFYEFVEGLKRSPAEQK